MLLSTLPARHHHTGIPLLQEEEEGGSPLHHLLAVQTLPEGWKGKGDYTMKKIAGRVRVRLGEKVV